MIMPELAPSFSTRLLRKGAFIEETYRVFTHWDSTHTTRENIDRIRRDNPLGAPNHAWLREITATLLTRFSHGESVEPLVILAKAGYPVERWRYCLLWHFAGTDGLFARFCKEFLVEQLRKGVVVFTTESVKPFMERLKAEGVIESDLSDYGIVRGARDLLLMAADFGLIKGTPNRRFTHDAIPEDAILYAIYGTMESVQSISLTIRDDRWKLFLMTPADVERELLNLHQYRRVRYEQAGSVRELSLPFPGLIEFTRSLVP